MSFLSISRAMNPLLALTFVGIVSLCCSTGEESVIPPTDEPAVEIADVVEREEPTARAGAMVLSHAATGTSQVATGASDLTEPPSSAAPLMIRVARQPIIVRSAPRHSAAIRGRIPMSHTFEVFALVEGPGCAGHGWADIGDAGFACLEQTRAGKAAKLQALPHMRDGDLAPFFYAKVPAGKVAQRWSSLADYLAGKPASATLESNHDYAFVTRRRVRGELLLFDERHRVVPEAQVHRYRPSRFEGRDLLIDPVPEGSTLAWTITWPETPVHSEPKADASLARMAGYHEELLLAPQPAADGWYALSEGDGYVKASDLRRFVVPARLPDVDDDEIWIDVELDEQVLTVMQGETPLFATLVSSGFKAPTPRGIFRIRLKEAMGAMSSEPGAADPYAVEAVPHVQFFQAGFALHAAYWHNRFGHRLSHGCVNLSPKDAARVFGMTSPRLGPGWIHGYETDTHLGTIVRVHRGGRPVADRRKEVELVYR